MAGTRRAIPYWLGAGALLLGCGGREVGGSLQSDASTEDVADGAIAPDSSDASCDEAPDDSSCGLVIRGPCAHPCMLQMITTTSGQIPCALVEALPGSGGEPECAGYPGPGLSAIDSEHTAYLDAARACWSLDESTPVCLLGQLYPNVLVDGTFTCTSSAISGWCYVETHADAEACATTVAFSTNAEPPAGAIVGLFCGP
ncbi:MAG: hypothetical protein ACRELB_14765 [Polyangiaceae bacterium]